MYQYPYGNAQQLNLDWILSKLQELESGSGGGADLEEVANALVSASFDATIPYRKYDYAFYDGKLYRALNDTIGAFNPADWMEVTLGADIPVLTRLVNADSALITTLQNQLQNLGSDEVANESTVTGTTVTAALDNLNGAITSLHKIYTSITEIGLSGTPTLAQVANALPNGSVFLADASVVSMTDMTDYGQINIVLVCRVHAHRIFAFGARTYAGVTLASSDIYYASYSSTNSTFVGWISLNNGKVNTSDYYYAANNTLSISQSCVFAGIITDSSKAIYFDIDTPKSMSKISTVSVTDINGAFRACTGGYIEYWGNRQWVGVSGYDFTGTKLSDNRVRIYLKKSSAMHIITNSSGAEGDTVANNSTVSYWGHIGLKFT